MLLASADGAKIGSPPGLPGQPWQASRHAHRLPQRQTGQALDRQVELNCRLAVFLATAPFTAGAAVPAMSLSSQTSNEPCTFRGALCAFQLVVRYFGFAGLMQLVYLRTTSGAGEGAWCNKAGQIWSAAVEDGTA